MTNKRLKRFNEQSDSNLSEIDDKTKSISIDFAKWLGDNRWQKNIRYDAWQTYNRQLFDGSPALSTSELFDLFISNYHK